MNHAGMGWPNGPVDNATILALPSPNLLMLSPEARWHHDEAARAGKTVIWRAIPNQGRRPAEVGWSPARAVNEVLLFTDEVAEPISDFIPWNELDLNYERGDDADDFADLQERYALLGGFLFSALTLVKQRLPGGRIHFPAWTPDHEALPHLAWWQGAAGVADVVDVHAYDSLDKISAQYRAYRAAFPNKPLALTEWHCKGDLEEERRVLAWLAETMAADPLFDSAHFFIWRWFNAPGWWSDSWDVEHCPERLALFQAPPIASNSTPIPTPIVEPTVPDLRAYARAAATRAGIDPDRFELQIQQESGFDPAAHNDTSGADGIAQIMPRWHPGVDTRDPLVSLDYAADTMADYRRRLGTDARALAAYNWGIGHVVGYVDFEDNVPPWDGRRESLPEETQHYLDVILGPGWESNTMPTMTYNPDAPVDLQPDDWSCSEQSAQWLLRSIGRNPGDAWIRDQLLSAGLVTKEKGLMDASGASLAVWLQREYGDEMGLTFSNDADVDWDELVEIAGEQPIMLGGRKWYHWTGVRYPTQEGTLALANPAPNWQAAGNELDRAEFDRLGPWSLITVALTASALPAPTPNRAAELVAEIEERLRELRELVA